MKMTGEWSHGLSQSDEANTMTMVETLGGLILIIYASIISFDENWRVFKCS
jgi:hypothetical protein